MEQVLDQLVSQIIFLLRLLSINEHWLVSLLSLYSLAEGNLF